MYPTHPLLMLAIGNDRRNEMLRAAQVHRLATAADRPEGNRRRPLRTRVSASSRVLAWTRLHLRHP